MAVATQGIGVLSLINNDHLTCQICQSGYQHPKALPCLHTFCSQCLRDYIFSRNYEQLGQFPCPLCRQLVELPEGGVDKFPDNHLIVTLMDTVGSVAKRQGSLYPDLKPFMDDEDLAKGDNPYIERDYSDQPSQSKPRSRHHRDPETPTSVNTGGSQRPTRPNRPSPPKRDDRPSRPGDRPSRHNAPVERHSRHNAPAERPSRHNAPSHHNATTKPSRQTPPSRPALPSRSSRGQLLPSRTNCETPTNLPNTHTVQRKLVLPEESYPVPIHYNVNGAEICFGQYGSGLTDFEHPVGLAVSPEGNIVVGDQRDNRVFIFESNGKLKSMFTCQGQIQDLTINSRGLFYIANTQARRSLVICYNARGHTVASFGNFFTYEKPHGVAVTSDNHMVITSIETNLVHVLNAYGKMTHKFVGKGKDGRRLSSPYHVAVTNKDRIIVSDHGNDCVKIFYLDGKCKMQFGKPGSKPGQFNGPLGVCVDQASNIVIVDSRNHRVQVFSPKGQFLGVAMQMDQRDMALGACPVNVAITRDSKLVVLLKGGTFGQIRVYPYRFQ